MKRHHLKTLLATVVFGLAFNCYGQNHEVDVVNLLITSGNYDAAIKKAKLLDTLQLSSTSTARLQLLMGTAYSYSNKNNKALTYLTLARNNYKRLDSVPMVDSINLAIIPLLAANSNTVQQTGVYIKDYVAHAKAKQSKQALAQAYTAIGKTLYNANPTMALQYYKLALQENQAVSNPLLTATIYNNMGACYSTPEVHMPDSALFVYSKVLKLYTQLQRKSRIATTYLNMGVAYQQKENYGQAIAYYRAADTCTLDEYRANIKAFIYSHWASAYKAMGNYKNALEYYEKEQVYTDSIAGENQVAAIAAIEKKYKTTEKELAYQKLSDEIQVKNMYLAIFSGVVLLLLLLGSLVYSYITKRRKIAEQEKTIETQKVQTILKEQQLHEIDIMLQSQEKERQRIANDLHDNLGSLLTALKMNFSALGMHEHENNTSKKLFEKTEELINETYLQVRNIAKLKNMGVVSKEGLLVAVTKMAEKMTVINRLTFQVIPFGLNGRLESNLEVTLFRMIQELCANIIKHSEATEVNIYLTQHANQELNIMIEDNGKGFDLSILGSAKAGIGLKNMEKKVEHLGGTFTIDSSIGNGTTVVIDIPL